MYDTTWRRGSEMFISIRCAGGSAPTTLTVGVPDEVACAGAGLQVGAALDAAVCAGAGLQVGDLLVEACCTGAGSPAGDLLVVVHRGVVKRILLHTLRLEHDAAMEYNADLGSLSVLRAGAEPELVSFNEVP